MWRSLKAVLVCTWLSMLFICPATAQDVFTPEQRQEKLKEIGTEIAVSKKFALTNQGWDATFKIALLVLAISAAAGSGYLAALGQVTPPTWLKIFNAVATVATAALTTFAFSQFDFAKRQAIWTARSVQLSSCQDALRYLNPKPIEFLAQLNLVLRIRDDTPISELNVTCIGAGGGASAGQKNAAPAASAASKP